MEKTVIKFGNIKIEKVSQTSKAYFNKKLDIKKIIVSNKVSLGKKGFNISLATKMQKK